MSIEAEEREEEEREEEPDQSSVESHEIQDYRDHINQSFNGFNSNSLKSYSRNQSFGHHYNSTSRVSHNNYQQYHPYYYQPYFCYPYQAYMMSSSSMSMKRQHSSLIGTGSEDSEPQVKKRKEVKAKRKCAFTSSIYKGVSWHKRDECYMGRVWVDGASKHVGSFKQEMKAAIAVDKALKELGKDETYMNFESNLERDIVMSILNNFETSVERSVYIGSVDKNGFPNRIESTLTKVIEAVKARKERNSIPTPEENIPRNTDEDTMSFIDTSTNNSLCQSEQS